MHTSDFFLNTLRETPGDAETISHQLMLRAGLIRKLASGVYTWLPLGLRVLRKVENIVREEMNRIGALELLMPAVQPAELWQETDRWDKFGSELLKIRDRHERNFCFGPTHEEVITDLMRRELSSYKQLPLTVYQIQMKFRDEIRPRFGVMRSREFLMKDAYSFHMDPLTLRQTYQNMYEAYTQIFTRLGLKFCAVLADTGVMGGKFSHEFQVLADSGEDVIAYSDQGDYAANIEHATALAPEAKLVEPQAPLEKFATPNLKTIQALTEALNIAPQHTVKTLIVKGAESPLIALVLRGDHELNPVKVAKIKEIAQPLCFANELEIKDHLGCEVGSIGVVGLKLPMIVDRDAAVLTDFVCGANEDGYHYRFVNWGRDAQLDTPADLRNVVEGDLSPNGDGRLKLARGIEVGQVFELGDGYSRKMNLTVLDANGKSVHPLMGCYGIGVTRVVAAAIEQHYDDRGIIWPESMAPFQVVLVPIRWHDSKPVQRAVEDLYHSLRSLGVEVLLDDRKERPGVLFADMDLIGIPHRIVVSEKGLDQGIVEYKARADQQTQEWPLRNAVAELKSRLQGFV
jgi:prolyl-tRNA synthetase